MTITGGRSIPNYYFSNISDYRSLTEVIIDNVATIEEYAFSKNVSLQKVVIGNGVEQIDRFAFADCTSLFDIALDSSISVIEMAAFIRCSALVSVILPSELTTISSHCFSGCKKLSKVTLSDSVKVFSANSFINCASRMTFFYNGSTTQWKDIQKWSNWILYSATITVHCANGIIDGK